MIKGWFFTPPLKISNPLTRNCLYFLCYHSLKHSCQHGFCPISTTNNAVRIFSNVHTIDRLWPLFMSTPKHTKIPTDFSSQNTFTSLQFSAQCKGRTSTLLCLTSEIYCITSSIGGIYKTEKGEKSRYCWFIHCNKCSTVELVWESSMITTKSVEL